MLRFFFQHLSQKDARWDQASFDSAYDTLPLDYFRACVREVFVREPYNPDVIRPGEHEPLVGQS